MEFNNEHSLKMNLFSDFEHNSLEVALPSEDATKEISKELKDINNTKYSKNTENTNNANYNNGKLSADYLNLINKLPLMLNNIIEELVKNDKITKKTKKEQIENRVFTELGIKLRSENINTKLSPETLVGIKNLIDIKVKAELDLI